MIALYIAAFIAGLLIGVAIMLFGIERRSMAAAASSTRSIRHWLPLLAAFAAGFGVAGYSLSRVLSAPRALVSALAIGFGVALLTRWLVAKSASMPVEHDVD